MKRKIILPLIAITMVMGEAFTTHIAFAQPAPFAKPIPPYAKWGKLAMRETQKRYPNAQIVDYLHVGRKERSSAVSEETFKFWLKEGSKEFGVYVRILFEKTSEKTILIQFEKTSK